MKIQLLPMSKAEFSRAEDVMRFLMEELPKRGGKYFYRRKSIVYKEDTIVAFQYDGKIVASAILINQSSNGMIENGIEYKAYFVFSPKSFVICPKPVTAAMITRVMPDFKGFNQSTQYLTEACIRLIR